MEVQQLINLLQRQLDLGRIEEKDIVKFRDFSVSEEAMEAGSEGYIEIEEALIVPGVVYLLAENS